MRDYETKFKNFLKKLSIQTGPSIGNEGFGRQNFIACPWISYWLEKRNLSSSVDGIFVMQDWWEKVDSDPLEKQVSYLKKRMSICNDDRTLKNLLNEKYVWSGLIRDRDWLVTNAVWRLREIGSGSTGWLGKKAHSKAFLIWVNVVLHFAKAENFKLVIAGAWGRFPDLKSVDILCYLHRWIDYIEGANKDQKADLRKKVEGAKGNVYFICHPAIWNRRPKSTEKSIHEIFRTTTE